MQIKVRLDRFLAENSLSAHRLARTLRGQVSQTTVYAWCRADEVKRLDLHTLAGVLGGLRQLTGREVSLSDLLEESQEGGLSSRVAGLLTALPADWDQLMEGSAGGLDPDDDAFWQDYREEQRQMEQHHLE